MAISTRKDRPRALLDEAANGVGPNQPIRDACAEYINACRRVRPWAGTHRAPRRPGELWIEVYDTGPGIPSNAIDRIFNPFFTTKDTGTGLGLAIVHRIVEAHDGSITASNCSDELGLGAKFEVRI